MSQGYLNLLNFNLVEFNYLNIVEFNDIGCFDFLFCLFFNKKIKFLGVVIPSYLEKVVTIL